MKKIHFDTIDSTNKYLKDNYEKFDSFTFVSADYQSEGKGRENRTWLANKNENLLFSVLIKDNQLINYYKSISLVSAVTIFNYLKTLGIKGLSIKWPNDVFVNDCKICGILLEGSIPNYLVVGIGLNVNQIEFDGKYRIEPTSIKKELNKTLELNDIRDILYNDLISDFNKLKNNDSSYLNIIRNNNYLLGKEKNVVLNGKEIKAKVVGINDNNDLLVEIDNKIVPIFSGEIN